MLNLEAARLDRATGRLTLELLVVVDYSEFNKYVFFSVTANSTSEYSESNKS